MNIDIEGRMEALAIELYEAVNDNASRRTPWTYLDPSEWEGWRRAANLAVKHAAKDVEPVARAVADMSLKDAV